ncbi:MAG: hypothetical protein QG648_262 [Patescibacteria group bacterium]|nr:hypothetical protein [Patescibacteria group bacterium]
MENLDQSYSHEEGNKLEELYKKRDNLQNELDVLLSQRKEFEAGQEYLFNAEKERLNKEIEQINNEIQNTKESSEKSQ